MIALSTIGTWAFMAWLLGGTAYLIHQLAKEK